MADSIWTKERIKELKRRFPKENTAKLADEMDISYEALKKKASRLGLTKSPRYLRSLRKRK